MLYVCYVGEFQIYIENYFDSQRKVFECVLFLNLHFILLHLNLSFFVSIWAKIVK